MDIQGANDEHECNPSLLLPVEVEPLQLPQRYGEHPYVKGDTDGRVDPGDGVRVHAVSLMLQIPLLPEESHRTTLQRGDRHEDDAVQCRKHNRPNQHPPDPLADEHAHEEGQQSQLQQTHVRQVQQLQRIEVLEEGGALVGREGPEVEADAVGHEPVDLDDGRGHAGDLGDEGEPVIDGKGDVGVYLEGEALDDEERREDGDGGYDDAEFVGAVADGLFAGAGSQVTGVCNMLVGEIWVPVRERAVQRDSRTVQRERAHSSAASIRRLSAQRQGMSCTSHAV